MPGLIEQVLKLGLERDELRKDHPGALVGGHRIPFPPKDMAAVVSTMKGLSIRRYLALEGETEGGVHFLEAHLHPEEVLRVKDQSGKELRKMLRTMTEPVDLITLDGRGLPLDADTLWRYILGGREEYAKEFGKGAPVDFGIPKLRPGGALVLNLADAGTREVWYRARAKFIPRYQSAFVGVVHVLAH